MVVNAKSGLTTNQRINLILLVATIWIKNQLLITLAGTVISNSMHV